MPKTATPKWAVIASWKRYQLAFTKGEATEVMKAWKEGREAEGFAVSGSQDRAFIAHSADPDVASQSARIIKLADHPVCYIGVVESDVQRLRAMEEAENPAFDEYSARAKAMSKDWRSVEAL